MFTPVDGFDGVLHMVPEVHPDDRGTFHEWFKASAFEEALGFPLDLQQAKDRSGGKYGNKGDECAIDAIKMAKF